MLKIKGCTDAECALLGDFGHLYTFSDTDNEKTVILYTQCAKDFNEAELTYYGDMLIAGYRANKGVSGEAQAVLDAAVEIHKTSSIDRRDFHETVRAYAATLAPPVDVEALERKVNDAAENYAKVRYEFYDEYCDEESEAWRSYTIARIELAAATAPPKPTRPELAEAVCESVGRYFATGWRFLSEKAKETNQNAR